MVRTPKYCQSKDIADWIRIDINSNTDPNTDMVENYIMANEDEIDRLTQHTWLTDKQVVEVFTVNKLWDWGRGLPIYPRHRNLVDFDQAAGDKLEIWDGDSWELQDVPPGGGGLVYFETVKGIAYLRGYLFTILRQSRFRLTYRYGGDNETSISETEIIPRDVQKACKLMTCIDILSTDFHMSQIAYGGEGNVDKGNIMEKWQREVDRIVWSHSEITTVW